MPILRNKRKTKRIGQYFALMRKTDCITQIEVAEELECSPALVRQFEHGLNDSMYMAFYYLFRFNDGKIPNEFDIEDGDYLCRKSV